MFHPAFGRRIATALAGAALASAVAVSGASAHHGTATPEAVPPPPSLMAASAAKEYEKLRAQGGQDLRMPDTRDAADGYDPAPDAAQPNDAPSEPSGFDLVSAAIGAAAAAGLAVLLVAFGGIGRRTARRQGAVGA